MVDQLTFMSYSFQLTLTLLSFHISIFNHLMLILCVQDPIQQLMQNEQNHHYLLCFGSTILISVDHLEGAEKLIKPSQRTRTILLVNIEDANFKCIQPLLRKSKITKTIKGILSRLINCCKASMIVYDRLTTIVLKL